MRHLEQESGLPVEGQKLVEFDVNMCRPDVNPAHKATPVQHGGDAAATTLEFSNCFACAEKGAEQRGAALSRNGTDFWGQSPDATDVHTGRLALGRDIIDHLNDWDWLIAHERQLKRGLEIAYGHMTPEAFEAFMKELNERSHGRIYMETGNGLLGSLNPLNPPGNLVVRCYLQRGGILTDDNIMDSRRLTYSPTYVSGGHTHDSNR